MRIKKIICLAIAICVCTSCLSGITFTGFAAPGGEETWDMEKQKSGLMTPFRPADQYVSKQNSPDFLWPYINGAQKYDLIVCSDPELKDIKYQKYDLEKNFYTFPTTFETGVHYYWAVRWYDGREYSEWSNPRRFRIDPDAQEFVYPGPEAIAARIPQGHPRIYATPDTLEEVRSWKDTNEHSKLAYENIVGTAKGYLADKQIPDEPIKQTSDNFVEQSQYNLALVGDANKLINMIVTCGVAYMLSGDTEIGEFGVECMKAISSWDINGATSYQSQDQVHRSIAYNTAIGFDLLYDLMDESERKIISTMIVERTKIMEHLLETLEKSAYDSHGWTAYGYIGIISIALYGEVPEAEEWFKNVINGYVSFLPPWSYQDGGWSQGTDYWQYSTNSNKEFIEVLALGNLIDLNQKAWSKNEYLWMLYAYPPGSYGSFGDQANRTKSSATYSLRTASRQLAFDGKNGVLKWLQNGWGGISSLDKNFMGYYAAAKTYDIEPKAPVSYPLAHEFDDIGWIVMTNDLIDQNRIQCTFKSSHYGSFNHSHPDQNSFIIQAYGENLAIKSGYYDAYHSNHDSGFTRKTGAHNTVTVATNRGQKDDDFTAKGQLTGFLNQVDFDLAAGDATQAYKGELDKFERCMIYIRPDIFVVVDELDAKSDKKESFEWWLNAENDIKVYEEGNGARLQEGNAVLDATIQYPRKVTTYYNNTFALSDMKEYPAEGSYKDSNVQRRVWFETEKVDRTKMVVTLDVHRGQTEARYVDTQYYDDYMKMTFEDGTVVLVNLQKTGTPITTAEGITFDGAAVTYNDETIMLALGTSLKWGDTQLIQCEERASVVMGKNEMGISTYTDQRISINTNNDYVNGITKVTNYEGKEISKEYGITMEEGMLVPSENDAEIKTTTNTAVASTTKTVSSSSSTRGKIGIPVATPKPTEEEPVGVVEETSDVTYSVVPNSEAVTFTLEKDNYTLMLNDKLISSNGISGNVRVTIEGEGTQEFPIEGYTRRDGTQSFSGTVSLDSKKYTIKSLSKGLDFGGMQEGSSKGMHEVAISAESPENEVVLERVPVTELEVDSTQDHESVKSAATVFIEAEDAVSFESGSVYTTRSFMSGGAGVSKHDAAGTSLEYNVEIPEDGDYQLAIKYVAWNAGGAVRSVSIDGKAYEISLPMTAGWGADPNDWVAVTSKDTLHLSAGTYTMYIEAVVDSWNVDWIAFTKK